jgi:diaminohydroxyphosphoribosylaminopyrimidine deaminase/5-amino-6-(5-phosphoribosylamino)uracil reductase
MSDQRYMALALSLGARTLGQTWPNPAVGCVIVQNGRIVGRGWTQPGGRPHAETQALGQAGAMAKGATAYVTLEPCSHTGKTPPCATALINAKIARVMVATTDPDARVSGQGLDMLRDAGIEVTVGVMEKEAIIANAGFLSRIVLDRPWVTLKLASSFDGRIATSTGESKWITGPRARRMTHAMRANHDAVMVGGGTARADDPSLTARDIGVRHQPVRVVLSASASIPPDSHLLRTAREVPVWLVHGESAPRVALADAIHNGINLIQADEINGTLDLTSVMSRLAQAGLTRIFCEGGGELAASLLKAGLVNELIGFSAGLVLGGDGTPSVSNLSLNKLDDVPRFDLYRTAQIGPDVLHIWRPR